MNVFSAIRARLFNAHPDHHAIARGMAWVILFVFLGKLVGASKEMAVAWRFGVSADVDAYLFVFNLVAWPIGVWFSVLTVVLVPLAARMRQDSPANLQRFRAELLAFTLLLGLVLGSLVWLGLPLLLQSSWTGLPATTIAIASHMVSALSLLVPLGVLISLFSAWMMSAGQYANTLFESVPALVILIALQVFPGAGVESLVWGTVAGFACHLVSVAIPSTLRGEIVLPVFTRRSPQWPVFWQGFGITLVGQALMSFIGIIDQFFAAHLGTGAIATLSYANRIMALILGLGATAVTRATLPVFAKAIAQGREQLCLHRVVVHWVRLLFVVGTVGSIVGWWLAPWAVKLLFERGAFIARDTEAVMVVLRYGLTQIPFYFAGLVLVSLLASHRKYKLLAISAGVNLFVKIVANFIFIPFLGINGIITATATMYMVSFLLLYWFVNALTKKLDIL